MLNVTYFTVAVAYITIDSTESMWLLKKNASLALCKQFFSTAQVKQYNWIYSRNHRTNLVWEASQEDTWCNPTWKQGHLRHYIRQFNATYSQV